MWQMNANAVASNVVIANIWTGWTIAGIEDLNGDGEADILWRDTTEETSVWLMDGPNISSSRRMGNFSTRMPQ